MRDGIVTLGPGVAVERVGGKAAGLMAIGALAPPGVVVTREVFDAMLDGIGDDIAARLAAVDPLDVAGLAAACEWVGARLDEVGLPDGFEAALAARCAEVLGPGPYIVRSSAIGEDGAAASFAGQLCSVLGVAADGLGAAVRACWRSRFLPGWWRTSGSGGGRSAGSRCWCSRCCGRASGGCCSRGARRMRRGCGWSGARGTRAAGAGRGDAGLGAAAAGGSGGGGGCHRRWHPARVMVGHALALAAARGGRSAVGGSSTRAGGCGWCRCGPIRTRGSMTSRCFRMPT
ncbi:MAG: PEP/pyruvate-binding domain-containing protein [bacterium]